MGAYTIDDIRRMTDAFKLSAKSVPKIVGNTIIVEMDAPNGICDICEENIATKIVIMKDNIRKLICHACDCGE